MFRRNLRNTKKILFRALKPLVQSPSLLYHSVSNDLEGIAPDETFHNITPAHFFEQLNSIRKKFIPVHLDELTERIKKGKKVNNLFSVSFDDGYRSVIENALPILTDLRVPATLFVNSGFQERPFWRDSVRFLMNQNIEQEFSDYYKRETGVVIPTGKREFYRFTKKSGHSAQMAKLVHSFLETRHPGFATFFAHLYYPLNALPYSEYLKVGNHTRDHYVLSDLSREEQWEQIYAIHEAIKGLSLNRTQCFSLPFGGQNTFDQNTLDILRELGYKTCLMSSGYTITGFLDRISALNLGELVLGCRFMPTDQSRVVLK